MNFDGLFVLFLGYIRGLIVLFVVGIEILREIDKVELWYVYLLCGFFVMKWNVC